MEEQCALKLIDMSHQSRGEGGGGVNGHKQNNKGLGFLDISMDKQSHSVVHYHHKTNLNEFEKLELNYMYYWYG